MDWTGCDLIEVIPGKYSGKPLIRGTRVPPEAIVANSDASPEEIHTYYPGVSLEVIQQILAYAELHSLQRASRRYCSTKTSLTHSV